MSEGGTTPLPGMPDDGPRTGGGNATTPPGAPPVPAVPRAGQRLRAWIGAHGSGSLIGGVVVAVIGAITTVALTALLDGDSDDSGRASPSASRSSSPGVQAESTPSCSGRTCVGLDPKTARCDAGAVTLRDEGRSTMLLEIRYSPRCDAVWAKLTGAAPGDTVTISTTPSRRQSASVHTGKTQYTSMLAVENDFSAQATAVSVKGDTEREIPKGYELRVGATGTDLPSPSPSP
ncbi:DUF2690 domain-containing protein [Streptomyces sp. NBC_00009]|uniref:DUF2690 domain-containing protein n=1 Tax=Streptomyces sp. NBC_00009 TaxID=2975620 RepID=UPI003248B68D